MNNTRDFNNALKIDVLTHYGNGILRCVKCNETRLNCLTVDHINNDGYKDKHNSFRSGNSLYRKLKAGDYPEGYQTLCMNCNINKALLLKQEKSSTTVIASRISRDLYDKVQQHIKLHSITITIFIKDAITAYLEKERESPTKQ